MATERVGKASREIENKNSQIWTIIQKKKILIGTGYGATILIQIILMSSVNAWKIGTIKNGERSKRRWTIEGKMRSGRSGLSDNMESHE